MSTSKKLNIALIGMMGCGKSSVAKLLSQRLGREVLSTDKMVETIAGCSIADIFYEKGEIHFRGLEKKALQEACSQERIIVDCGGGIILDSENRQLLRQKATLFYLSASPEFLYEKIKGNQERPLLQVSDPVGKLGELLSQRRSFYEEADYTVVSEGKRPAQICDEIMEILI